MKCSFTFDTATRYELATKQPGVWSRATRCSLHSSHSRCSGGVCERGRAPWGKNGRMECGRLYRRIPAQWREFQHIGAYPVMCWTNRMEECRRRQQTPTHITIHSKTSGPGQKSSSHIRFERASFRGYNSRDFCKKLILWMTCALLSCVVGLCVTKSRDSRADL